MGNGWTSQSVFLYVVFYIDKNIIYHLYIYYISFKHILYIIYTYIIVSGSGMHSENNQAGSLNIDLNGYKLWVAFSISLLLHCMFCLFLSDIKTN